jgi:hypothetical protein
VKPSSACITANVTNSASLIFGSIPTRGRHGNRCGDSINKSSTVAAPDPLSDGSWRSSYCSGR